MHLMNVKIAIAIFIVPKVIRFPLFVSEYFQSPLHLAAIMDQPTTVESLLHAGADPSIADRHGNTAAHLAVANSAHQCLASLVKYLRPGLTKADPFPELNYLNYDGNDVLKSFVKLECLE